MVLFCIIFNDILVKFDSIVVGLSMVKLNKVLISKDKIGWCKNMVKIIINIGGSKFNVEGFCIIFFI